LNLVLVAMHRNDIVNQENSRNYHQTQTKSHWNLHNRYYFNDFQSINTQSTHQQ